MRAAYHSEYRPGAADTSELDPCIAAETRLKKSAFSTRKTRTLVLIAILAFLLATAVVVLIIALSRPEKTSGVKVGDFEYEDLSGADIGGPATTTTTAATTVAPTTTGRPSRVLPFKMTTSSPPTTAKMTTVMARDEQPKQIQRVELAPQQQQLSTEQPTTTTTTTTAPTARPTLKTRPASVFPTVPLHDELPYERRTEDVKESCSEHAAGALGSGVYRVDPEGKGEPFDVYCRVDEDDVVGDAEGVFRAGGAWTYFQNLSENVYFHNRTWNEYVAGFGRVNRSHWLGLNAMHRLAPGGKNDMHWTLRIELYGDFCAEKSQCSGAPDGMWWGEWDFGLAGADDHFRLHISPARYGNLTAHTVKDVFYEMNNGQQFTTLDVDHDVDKSVNCGQFRNFGGWWHSSCTWVALNGKYGDDKSKLRYQVWFRSALADDKLSSAYHIHPKRSIMMVRPRA